MDRDPPLYSSLGAARGNMTVGLALRVRAITTACEEAGVLKKLVPTAWLKKKLQIEETA